MKQVDYDASAASNDGTPISFSVPTGIQAGNNYFFVLFAYADARRKMLNNVSPAGTAAAETQTYVTGAFTVYDYAPTPAPSPSPSTAAPSARADPTMNPTYEPTSKPVEDIPCTATVESGIPDDKVWEWGQDVELKIKMCHWYSYSYGVVDVLLYGDVAGADPVDSLAQYQSVHDNTLTVKYTAPQCTEQDRPTHEQLLRPLQDVGPQLPRQHGRGHVRRAAVLQAPHHRVRPRPRHGRLVQRRHVGPRRPRRGHPHEAPPGAHARADEGAARRHDRLLPTALFAGTGGANQVEMNKIRKFSSYGAGTDLATTPLAPGDSIFANIEYWPLDRYSSGRGTARDGTFHKHGQGGPASDGATTTTGAGRFVYPYVDGPIANTDGALLGSGIAKEPVEHLKRRRRNGGTTPTGGRPRRRPGAGCENDADCATAGGRACWWSTARSAPTT